MATELNDNLNEDQTVFTAGGTEGKSGVSFYYPRGAFGKFFARFFATKAQPELIRQQLAIGSEPPLTGDAPVRQEQIGKPTETQAAFSTNRTTPVIEEMELNRKARYREYEKMDEYPEVGAAFDIYADDCTQRNTKNERWGVKSKNPEVVKEIKALFETLKLDRLYWDITRNVVKFGDCFTEIIMDMNNPKAGIQRVKILNPNYTLRIEDAYGYLQAFFQEIPNRNNMDNFGYGGNPVTGKSKYVELDKNQIVHFKLFTSDPKFYPYGKSIAALSVRIFRSLRLMEDAMLIYRLARAPERRIFYIDVGNLPTAKAEMFIERVKEKFKKEKFYNKGGVDGRYNPLSADEDFFVPVKGGSQGTKIETLPGAQNLGEVADVQYFRDKLLASLKIPKDYIVEKDKSPERKANLSQLDVKFARTITRMQHAIEHGLEDIAKRHLVLKGFPTTLINEMRIELPDPSDMFTKRKLDIDDAKIRIIQTVTATGLFPKDHIYKEYYDMSEGQVKEIKQLLEKEAKEAAAQQNELEQISPGAGQNPQGNQPAANANTPTPTPTREELINKLGTVKKQIIRESGFSDPSVKAINRILNKINSK